MYFFLYSNTSLSVWVVILGVSLGLFAWSIVATAKKLQYCYLKRRSYPLHWIFVFFHPCGSENIHFSIISHLVCWFPLQKHNFTVFPFSNWFVNNRFISLGAIYPCFTHSNLYQYAYLHWKISYPTRSCKLYLSFICFVMLNF